MELKLKRECGECSACCVWFDFDINGTHKPMQTPCKELCNEMDGTHSCNGTNNCGIYETRPKPCREYICAWLYGYGNEEDRPDKSGIMLDNIEWVPGAIVAKQMWRSAYATKAGEGAIRRISEQMDKPVLILSTNWVIGKPVSEQYIKCIGRGYRKP